MPELQRLLARVGLAAPPPTDAGGLAALHRAYVAAMPYESIAIALEQQAPLDSELIAERVLQDGRGGYCFELNGLLGRLLEELGFRVERHEARAGPREEPGPTNHLMLTAALPDDGPERWLVDSGLGEGWLDPLPLREGVHTSPGGLTWRLEREPGGWWVDHHEWGSFPGLHVSDEVVPLAAFAPHHERFSHDPASPFVQTFVAQRPADDRVTTLRARTLTVRGPQVDEHRLIRDPDDLAETLQARFGITLNAKDTAVLWDRIRAQHDAWLASR